MSKSNKSPASSYTTISKRDVVDRVSEKVRGLNKQDVGVICQHFLDELAEALVKGERLEFRNFGVFTPRIRKARVARNPKTGALVAVASGRSAAFKPGKELRARLNGLPAPAKPGVKPVVKTATPVKSPAK